MKIKILALVIALLSLAFLFSSCSDDDAPTMENPEEEITTVTLTFTPVSSPTAKTLVVTIQDLDGEDGGSPPVQTVDSGDGSLSLDTDYNLVIQLLNENDDNPVLTNPEFNISLEVLEEGAEHQFFFAQAAGVAPIFESNFEYRDEDDDGNPIGLETRWTTTGTAGNGEFQVILRHELDKNASGVPEGNIANAGGDTDVNVTFDISVN